MKRHLNTLFVTTQGSYLAKEGESLLVRHEGNTRLRVPSHMLGSVVCFGQVGFSPFLLGLCGKKGIGVSFLTENGRFLARVMGPTSGNVLLRRAQYRWADDSEKTLAIARTIVLAKIANSRTLLRRVGREHKDTTQSGAISQAADRLGFLLRRAQKAADLDALRGHEGEAARTYFSVFDHLILTAKQDFVFAGRNRRPPLDPVNALLSFIYTLLARDISSALDAAGLDPAVGYLHRDRPGRPSLALDLLEELRAPFADRLALTLINRSQVKASGFRQSETGRVEMDDTTRKALLVAYQERKQATLTHPFLGEKTTVGLLPHLQARLLARYLRGDLDGYPPFLVR